MFQLEFELEGMDQFREDLRFVDSVFEDSAFAGIQTTVMAMEGTAKELCPVGDTGDLRSRITSDVKKTSDGAVGAVGTNHEAAPYVEFGTGPKGRDTPAEGKYPGPITYRSEGWWIHESQIDRRTAEKYHFFPLETPDGIFYFTMGQPAQPFLYPALMAHKDDAPKNIAAEIEKRLKERQG